jgi:hypothetical protein
VGGGGGGYENLDTIVGKSLECILIKMSKKVKSCRKHIKLLQNFKSQDSKKRLCQETEGNLQLVLNNNKLTISQEINSTTKVDVLMEINFDFHLVDALRHR